VGTHLLHAIQDGRAPVVFTTGGPTRSFTFLFVFSVIPNYNTKSVYITAP
jgi:hypothetical protein